MKICPNGHVTGAKKCPLCGARTTQYAGNPITHALDKRLKRRVTQAIREAGGVPVADMKGGCGIGGPNVRRRGANTGVQR